MIATTSLPQLPGKTCTGCGGCTNICPKDAIFFAPDAEGFQHPVVQAAQCIGCKKCEQICPVLHWESSNIAKPDLYAVRGADDIRANSSSGGVFSLAAEEVFARKGVVVGAAFDKNLHLSLSIAKNEKQLAPMRGSKYVQSDPELVYRDALKCLKAGKLVLFTGCPCQVAAMKNIAGNKYSDLLYTIDLLCHGVPSQAILQRYLEETFPGKQAVDVRFRDKSHGWIATYIDVDFSDGTSYHGANRRNDPYERIFQNNIALRPCCHNCKFCTFPRTGDLTMGDFWGIQKIDPSQTDGKGTSMVFLNNEKGKQLFTWFQPKTDSKQMQVNLATIPNRLKATYPPHPGRSVFFPLLRTKSMEEIVKMVMDNQHDIGLVGIHTVGNFGGALTYFALYKVLCDLGYSVLMIERPGNCAHKPALTKIYGTSPYPAYDTAKIYPNKPAMKELNQFCKMFVVGSDQLFNDGLYNNFGRWCTLDWVQDNKKKIAYAASFGHDYIWSPEETRAEMAHFMQRFDAFSVREQSGVDICKKEFGVDAQWVLDPVFLCKPEYYRELAKQSTQPIEENYLGAYILDPTKEKADILRYAAKKKKLSTTVYTEMAYRQKDLNDFDLPVQFGGLIEDRLANIIHSDFFIADSFHGICFAILMKKNFVAIVNEKRGKSRFESILGLLGLKDRLISNLSELKQKEALLTTPVDYDAVYKILEQERHRCLTWLRDALADPTKKPLSTYDLLTKRIDLLSERVSKLMIANATANRKIAHLVEFAGFSLTAISDFSKYFKALQANIENYVIAIAVKDTPGLCFTDALYADMQRIGVTINLTKKHWYGYAAIIDGGNLLAENSAYQKVVTVKATTEDGIAVVATSKPLKVGNATAISFNGVGGSVCRRGINIMVYDKTKKCVCDSVCFDTHVKGIDCHR